MSLPIKIVFIVNLFSIGSWYVPIIDYPFLRKQFSRTVPRSFVYEIKGEGRKKGEEKERRQKLKKNTAAWKIQVLTSLHRLSGVDPSFGITQSGYITIHR